MKQTGIPKETFTIANIRSDLRKKLWKSWLLLALYVALIVLDIYLLHIAPEVIFDEHTGRYPGWFYFIFIPFIVYLSVKEAWWLLTGYCKKPVIVKDTLVSSEGEASHSTHTYRTYYCTLCFAHYGEYFVPEKNHRWSKLYPLSCKGEYIYAMPGDEYYLVLSKPHSGKILLAYNAKLFELESEQV